MAKLISMRVDESVKVGEAVITYRHRAGAGRRALLVVEAPMHVKIERLGAKSPPEDRGNR